MRTSPPIISMRLPKTRPHVTDEANILYQDGHVTFLLYLNAPFHMMVDSAHLYGPYNRLFNGN